MARFTRAIPQSCNVLAAIAGMDEVRRLSPGVETPPAKSRQTWWHRLGRSLRRRNLLSRKKRGADVGLTKHGKGTRIMLMVDSGGTPVSAFTCSAGRAEVHAIETLVEDSLLERYPEHLLYDKAADCNWLRDALNARKVELVCPHRKRRKHKRQDGRALRRYWRRFVVERSISWLQNYRRLAIRYEYYDYLFEGFLQLACLFTIIKRF